MRVESRIGNGESDGLMNNGISGQAKATASQPLSPRSRMTFLKVRAPLGKKTGTDHTASGAMSIQHEHVVELCGELRPGAVAAQYSALAQEAASSEG
jgi:hypothetical protein